MNEKAILHEMEKRETKYVQMPHDADLYVGVFRVAGEECMVELDMKQDKPNDYSALHRISPSKARQYAYEILAVADAAEARTLERAYYLMGE